MSETPSPTMPTPEPPTPEPPAPATPPEAVFDASAAAAFALADEKHHAGARACLAVLGTHNTRLLAPPLFESELDRILRRRVFLGTLTPQAATAVLRVVDALQFVIVYDPATRAPARTIAEALNQMRVYDATYAALAQRRGCRMWTADKRFYNAATDEGRGGVLPFVRFIGAPTEAIEP